MRQRRIVRVAAALGAIWLLAGGAPANAGPSSVFQVWHQAPGLILRGEPVVIHVEWETTDGGDPPTAYLFVRDDVHQPFTRLRLFGSGTHRIPAKFLDGGFVEDYVVLHDSGSDAVRRVPATGAFRSWIRDSFHTIDLGKHVFGHIRQPDSIVARATIGDGPHQVAWFCPPEGLCEYPWSFDVGPNGQVWMLDPHNERIVGWFPRHPNAPARTIPIHFGPADLAIGANGTVFVLGVKVGDPVRRLRVYAFAPNGDLLRLWHANADIFNDHLRFGGDGVLYCVDSLAGWVPLTDADGHPLRLDQQRRMTLGDEPIPGNQKLVARVRGQHEQRLALATDGGLLRRAWRITSTSPMGDFGGRGTPDVVNGDPVVDANVFDFQQHLEEHVILRLSRTDGVVKRFSLGRSVEAGVDVTTLRVGPDGAFYQLQGSPEDGFVRVARYSLSPG